MEQETVSLEELELTREQLIRLVNESLTEKKNVFYCHSKTNCQTGVCSIYRE